MFNILSSISFVQIANILVLERESDIQKFLNDLPQNMVNRDLWLEGDNQRENRISEPVTERMGSLAQRELIVEFYSEHSGLTSSFYSGEDLITLQRAGVYDVVPKV
jgi:hypothetical protein